MHEVGSGGNLWQIADNKWLVSVFIIFSLLFLHRPVFSLSSLHHLTPCPFCSFPSLNHFLHWCLNDFSPAHHKNAHCGKIYKRLQRRSKQVSLFRDSAAFFSATGENTPSLSLLLNKFQHVFFSPWMPAWHVFILLQKTFASTSPHFVWTRWSYLKLSALMIKLLLFTRTRAGHSHACYDPLYTPTSQNGGEQGRRELERLRCDSDREFAIY